MNKQIDRNFIFGKVDYNNTGRKTNLVELEVGLEVKQNNEIVFTVIGQVWNSGHTDIYCGGQCVDTIWKHFATQIENPSLYKQIMQLWEKWHLNDLNAGCRHQRKQKMTYQGNCGNVCRICNYPIGTSWKYNKINDRDLKSILSLLRVNSLETRDWLRLNKTLKSK